jgi:hypothetical protein
MPFGETPVSFVVSGKVEHVKAAVQQLEWLLGLEVDLTVIMLRDVPTKNGGNQNDSPTSKNNSGGTSLVENDKKKHNPRNKLKRKPTK